MLVDQRVCGRRDRIGLDSAVELSLLPHLASARVVRFACRWQGIYTYPRCGRRRARIIPLLGTSGGGTIRTPAARYQYVSPLSAPSCSACSCSARSRRAFAFWPPVLRPLARRCGPFFFTPTCSPACAASLALVSFAARTSSASTSKPCSSAACRPLLLLAPPPPSSHAHAEVWRHRRRAHSVCATIRQRVSSLSHQLECTHERRRSGAS